MGFSSDLKNNVYDLWITGCVIRVYSMSYMLRDCFASFTETKNRAHNKGTEVLDILSVTRKKFPYLEF